MSTIDERKRSPSGGEHRSGKRPNGSPRDSGSEVYVTSAAYRPPSEISVSNARLLRHKTKPHYGWIDGKLAIKAIGADAIITCSIPY
ncbi:hypothetical protein KGM_212933 [Danaus plexippus plexippus]|uniref:Uncharacterized protein n=1 Tax=Danaus plexippus plexippus TaxID=278856 RepID=A0A212FJM9_DANPL|nr:hypothetical protein KGM_212933 [Danaus plexippus plexippus]